MKKLDAHRTFFTSDLHIGHKAVIGYCNRPWFTTEEMDEGLIERWNEVVPRDGVTFIAGDAAMCKWDRAVSVLSRMNGQKVLVRGNHDGGLVRKKEFQDLFVRISPLLEIGVKDEDAAGGIQRIVLCHFAMRTWNLMHRGAWHLYGHSHGSLEEDGSRSFDIGVDSHNWYPWTYQEVKDKMATKTFTQIDHHGERE